MIKRPFIFLSADYGANVSNGLGTDLSGILSNLTVQDLPYEQTVFFTDKWGNVVNREIDTVMFAGTNLASVIIEASDNSGEYSPLWNLSGNTESDFLLKLPAPVTTSSLRITLGDVEDGNPQTVNIGKIGVHCYLLDLLALTDAQFKKDTDQGFYRTIAGQTVFYGNFNKLDTKLKAENLPKAQFEALTAQIDAQNKLTVLPFYDDSVGKVYECYVSPEYSFELDRKTGLYGLTLELKEL